MHPVPLLSRERRPASPLPLACVALVLLGAGCGTSSPSSDLPDPVFTDPLAKLQETGDRIGFSETLFAQYVHQETALVDPTVNVFMAFFAGADQRGLALSFIDTTNFFGGRFFPQPSHLKARGIWIEGTGDWQYAAYRMANEQERWWERSAQEDPTNTGTPLGNQVVIHGQTYTDPFPVTNAQYRQIWANYSAAYADMAKLFHGRGLPVHARAFIRNPSSTSAFWTECRTLRDLMASGDVDSFLCAGTSFPSYERPADWVECPNPCQPSP
jgi:hypothetical protein